MTSQDNPNVGPAFPVTYQDCDDEGSVIEQRWPGMSLRDWFAGQALAGIDWTLWFEDSRQLLEGPELHEELARCAYATADAMLRARLKKPADCATGAPGS